MQYSSMRRSGDRRTGMRAAMAVCALVAATAVVAATAPGVAAAPGDLQSSSFALAPDNDYAHGIWSDGTTLWVADYDDGHIYAYTLATGARDSGKDISAPEAAGNRRPFGLWSDGTTIWVPDPTEDTVFAYNLASGEPNPELDVDTLLSYGHNASAIGVWSDGATVWVGDWWDDKIYAYDLHTGRRQADREFDKYVMRAAGNDRPRALWSDGVTMWVVDDHDDKIYAYGLHSRTRRPGLDFDTLQGAGNHDPSGLWSDGTTMYVADHHDNKIYAYEMRKSAALGGLRVGGAAVELPAGRLDLAVRVPSTTATATVEPTAAFTGSTITISPADADAGTDGHQISLSQGDNSVTVTVSTASDTRTYTAVVTRTDAPTLSDDPTLEALSLSGMDIGTFDSATTGYTASVATDVTSTTVTATPADEYASVAISPADADTGTDGHQVDLTVGANAITVTVESSDGTSETAYRVAIHRASPEEFGQDPTKELDTTAGADNPDPRGVWSDGTTLWVADNNDGKVHAYDLAAGTRLTQRDVTTLADAGNDDPLGVWSDGTTMWIVDGIDRQVYAYELDTGARIPSRDVTTLSAAGNHSPRGVWSDGTTMWVSDDDDAKVYAYHVAGGARSAALDVDTPAGAGNHNPRGLWSDGVTIWVADNRRDRIFAYDLATGERSEGLEFDTLAAAGNHDPWGLWSDGATMWATDTRDGKVYAYNMPATAVLESLELDGAGVAGFAPSKLSYAARMPGATATATVAATASGADATVAITPADADTATGGHQVALSTGANTVAVTVTNGGRTTIYTLVVTRSTSDTLAGDATLSGLDLSGVDLGAFDPATTSYSADVGHHVSAATVIALASSPDATVTISPADADVTTAGHQVALEVGANTVTVAVESSDGNADSTYTVTVTRAPPAAFARDTARDFRLQRLSSRPHANGIWSDGTIMWVSDRGPDGVRFVYAYDLATGERVADRDITSLSLLDTPDDRVDLLALPAEHNNNPDRLVNDDPWGLWSDGFTLWVSDSWIGPMFAYNLVTGGRIGERDIGLLKPWEYYKSTRGVWSDGTTMWAVYPRDDKIYAYDFDTRERTPDRDITTLEADGFTEPWGMWSDGTTLWVAGGRPDEAKIYAYDLATGARTPSLDFDTLLAAGNIHPRGLWSDGATMYVLDAGGHKVYAYNMPESAALRSLELDGAEIGFAAGRLDYAAPVANTITETTVHVEAAIDGTSVTISPADADTAADGHQVSVGDGDTTITVTAVNGDDTRTYTVVLSRVDLPALSSDPGLDGLTLSDIDFDFDPKTFRSTVAAVADVATTTVTVTPVDQHATVTIIPADADVAADGHQVDLRTGKNTIKITVVSSDGRGRTTYFVEVNRSSAEAFGWNASRDFPRLSAPDGPYRPRRWSNGSVCFYSGGGLPKGCRGTYAEDLWSDGTTMWVVDDDDDKVFAYDLATGTRTPEHDITTLVAAGNSYAKGVWSDGVTMWVSDWDDHKVYAYNLATGDRAPGRDLNRLLQAGNITPMAVWSDGTTMWVGNMWDGRTHAYDLATGAPAPDRNLDEVRSDKGISAPGGMWSDGITLWVVSTLDAKIYAFSVATGDRVPDLDFNTLRAAGNRLPTGLWSDGTTAWVGDMEDDKLFAYNMPELFGLDSLELDGIDFGTFTLGRLDYAANVPSATTATTVIAVPSSDSVTVTVTPADADTATDGHQVNLATGDNTVTVTVAEGDETKTYTVVVTRVAAPTLTSDATLSSLALSGIDFGTFDPATTRYSFRLAASVADATTTTVTAVPVDANATLTISPADADADTDGHQVELGTTGTITVAVVSSDGRAVVFYLVTLHRTLDPTSQVPDATQNTRLRHELFVKVPPRTTRTTLNATALHGAGAVNITPEDADDTTEGHQVDLEVTDEVTVTVEVSGGGEPTVYTVVFRRAEPACEAVWCGSLDAVAFRGPWTWFAGFMGHERYAHAGSSVEPAVFSYDGTDYEVTALVGDAESGTVTLGLDPTPTAEQAASLRLHVGGVELAFSEATEFTTVYAAGFLWADTTLLGGESAPIAAGSVIGVRITEDPTADGDGDADSDEAPDPDSGAGEAPDGDGDGDADSDEALGAPLTAEFVAGTVPQSHSGSGTFTVRVRFSEPIATSYKTLRDEILQVGNGTAVKFRRVDRRNDLWEIHVAPDGAAAVTLSIAAVSDCTSTLHICTGGGKALSNTVSLVVPGPSSDD